MREILFRGKRVDNGEWVTGDRVLIHGESFIYCEPVISTSESGETDRFGVSGYKVDPSTVGQYTGITDRKGNRIFEGDIVKESSGDIRLLCDIGVRKRSHIGVVKFGRHEVPSEDPYCWGEAYGFYVCGDVFTPTISMYRPLKDNWGNGFNLEISGNIHDNPDLLK